VNCGEPGCQCCAGYRFELGACTTKTGLRNMHPAVALALEAWGKEHLAAQDPFKAAFERLQALQRASETGTCVECNSPYTSARHMVKCRPPGGWGKYK
jgi:hypothetical protein